MEDYFDDKYIFRSSSLIQFITNGLPCYIKLKNYVYGMYLKINNSQVIGDITDGTIFIMKPDYTQTNVSLSILDSENIKNKIVSYKTNSVIKISNDENKTLDTQFYLYGNLDEIQLYSCHKNRNMFGNIGRFIFMTEEGYIHADGGVNMEGTKWQIEKINDVKQYIDCRADCMKINKEINYESRKNLEGLFPNIIKHLTFFNIGYNKNLQVLYQSNPTSNVYDHKLIGHDDKIKFILRPIQNENCVFISQYYNGKYINIYTLPRHNCALMGAPDCNWAKFYIIKRKDHYLFQCFHRESDPEGGYGRYLCMRQENENVDKFSVFSDGSEKEECSMWKLI